MQNIDWRENTVKELYKQYLEDIIQPILKGETILAPAAIDAILTIIFTNLDFFGFVRKGSHATSSDAVAFIREYLGRVDARYSEVGGLLYHMIRHGMVHKFSSKTLKYKTGEVLDFEYGFGNTTKPHLTINKRGDRLLLFVNITVLCSDVFKAIDLFATDVRNNPELAANFEKAFYSRRSPETEKQMRRGRAYLNDSDFNYLDNLLNQSS